MPFESWIMDAVSYSHSIATSRIFRRVDTIHERDGHQTDGHRRHRAAKTTTGQSHCFALPKAELLSCTGGTPLSRNPLYCCRRLEPGRIFFLKTALTCTADFIRSTRWGPDPNRPTYGSKEGGCDLEGFVPGGLVD